MALTNFIPQIWSSRLLAHLDKNHVYANLVNRNYEGDISDFGDTVKINQIGAITIKDYTKNTDIADAEDLTGAQKTLTINQAKYFNFQIDDIENAQTKPKVMDGAMQRAAYGLSDAADMYIASLQASAGLTIGNDGAPIEVGTVSGSVNAYETLVDMAIKMDEANVPTQGRWVVVPPWYHGLLRKDERFVHATEMGDNVLRTGLIGEAAGFAVYKSNNVPNTGGNSKFKILGGHPEAITFAEQIVKTEAYRMEKRFSDAVKGLHVYGAVVQQPKALCVLTANHKIA